MAQLRHIAEGLLYAAGAAIATSLSDDLSALHLGEPYNILVVAAIGLLAYARSWLDARYAALNQ